MDRVIKAPLVAMIEAFALLLGLAAPLGAATVTPQFRLAQTMVPPTRMMDVQHPTPMNVRYLKRLPRPVRVGNLIGLPLLDHNASTLGYVRQVVRTPQGEIELIVSYSRWCGWFCRPVAVPTEVVGIEGRQMVSLDMPPSAYAAVPTWQGNDATSLPAGATMRVALARS